MTLRTGSIPKWRFVPFSPGVNDMLTVRDLAPLHQSIDRDRIRPVDKTWAPVQVENDIAIGVGLMPSQTAKRPLRLHALHGGTDVPSG
jgi:hypothetical protein